MVIETMTEETNNNVEKRYTDPETGKFTKGNPGGGRPKGSVSVVEAIKKKLEEEVPKELTKDGNPDKKTYRDYLVATLMKKAINEKDVGMIKDIIDRVDGKPNQKIDQKTTLTLENVLDEIENE